LSSADWAGPLSGFACWSIACSCRAPFLYFRRSLCRIFTVPGHRTARFPPPSRA